MKARSIDMTAEAILWGATGQARVVRPILEENSHRVVRVFDNAQNIDSPFPGIPFGGNWSDFLAWRTGCSDALGFVVCIGGLRGRDRSDLSRNLVEHGLVALSAVHSRSFVAQSCQLGSGIQVLAMAALSENVRLGDFCIVNTNATVDHDCSLGTGVHVMPGATIAGEVDIGDFVSVGSNATVLPRIRIGEGAVIGAGAVVIRDVDANSVVVGCPARPIERQHFQSADGKNK